MKAKLRPQLKYESEDLNGLSLIFERRTASVSHKYSPLFNRQRRRSDKGTDAQGVPEHNPLTTSSKERSLRRKASESAPCNTTCVRNNYRWADAAEPCDYATDENFTKEEDYDKFRHKLL
jgi:hypothetical protein